MASLEMIVNARVNYLAPLYTPGPMMAIVDLWIPGGKYLGRKWVKGQDEVRPLEEKP